MLQSFSYNALDQFTADAAGTVTTVAYSPDGDQTQLSMDKREPISLVFDPRHLVTSQTVTTQSGPATTSWSIDGSVPRGHPDQGLTLTTSFVTGPGGLLATYAHSGGTAPPTFAVQNGHGDVIQTRDTGGNLLETYVYDENGSLTSTQTPTPYGYVGRWQKDREEDPGLIRMGVRMYDPVVRRFASWDPVDGGDFNAYSYAGANPINDYDLTGQYHVDSGGGRGSSRAESAGTRPRRTPPPRPRATHHAKNRVGTTSRAMPQPTPNARPTPKLCLACKPYLGPHQSFWDFILDRLAGMANCIQAGGVTCGRALRLFSCIVTRGMTPCG